LYVGQGSLTAVRAGDEAIIVDAHMPTCDTVTCEQIEASLDDYLTGMKVRGLILTGLDDDHACPIGVSSILTRYQPDWVMYPKYYKDTDAATEVFRLITQHESRRKNTSRPLSRQSVRVDQLQSRKLRGLGRFFDFELFSPHMSDMDTSNNSSIVLKVTGMDESGFRYLVTGDTERERWATIFQYFKDYLESEVMAAPHHGSTNGVHPASLLAINPNTVLISAGVDSPYGHPDALAVAAYASVAQHVFSTHSEDGTCLFTRRLGSDFETHAVRHNDVVHAE
jgi:beta-lactamase superfamily II metal-dependent hydrolase